MGKINKILNHEKLLEEIEETIEKMRNDPKNFNGIAANLLANILFEIDKLKLYYGIE